MSLLVIGLNHTTASVAIRERFAIDETSLVSTAQSLVYSDADEAFVLSTCNRVEFYLTGSDLDALAERAQARLLELGQMSLTALNDYCYIKRGREAIAHLFRVAASLDSMVIGEPQILGQLKSAVQMARLGNTIGSHLSFLTDRAFATAKKVRNETGIGRSSISISSVAVDLARQVFGDFQDRKVLLLGAGKMAELAAAQFKNTGAQLVIANRGRTKADELAAKIGGVSRTLDEINELIEHTDIVIASTGSRSYLFDSELMNVVMKKRKYRPIFLIDIAVPRNLDPSLNRIDGVYLYDLDALSTITQENVRKRQSEADLAEKLVGLGIEQLEQTHQQDRVKPTIIALRAAVLQTVEREVHTLSARLNLEDESILRRNAEIIANKVLHGAIEELKKSAGTAHQEAVQAAILRIFDAEEKNS